MTEGLELVPVIVAGVYYMYTVDAQLEKKDAGASANQTYAFILSLYCFFLKRRLLDAALSSKGHSNQVSFSCKRCYGRLHGKCGNFHIHA